jgi:hypothetical protein
MSKDEASAIYFAHCAGVDVPFGKFVEALAVLKEEGVLVR